MYFKNKRTKYMAIVPPVTVDETWIHWHTPEAKNSPDEPSSKKAKVTIFWGSYWMIYIDYLEKDATNGV